MINGFRHQRRAVLLAAACWAALTGAGLPAGANAPPQDAKGDVFAPSARELMQLVRQKCVEDSSRLMVGVESMPVMNSAFTKDQGHHVVNRVYSALSQIGGHKMTPFHDIGAVTEVISVGLGDKGRADVEKRLLDQINLVVRVDGQKVGRNVRFRLSAIGRNDVQCAEATTYFEAPQSVVGDVYVPVDQIFTRAARELWDRSRGSNQVALQARSVTGAGLDAQLPGYFERILRNALNQTRDDFINLGTPTELVVVPRRDASADRDLRWDADVVVEQVNNGFRIEVDVTRPNVTAISHAGIVAAEDMPSLRRADLARTAAIKRVEPPRQERRQQQRPQQVRATPGEVPVLQFGITPTRIVDSLDDQNPEPRYGFRIERESFVEFDVERRSGPSAIIKPELVGSNGMPIKALVEGKARPNLRRFRLSPGNYEVSLTTEGRGRHEFTFSSRAVDVSRMLEPEPPGRLTRKFQDWYAGETRRGGKKVCYVYTTAMEAQPVGWREQRPFIWLSFGEDKDEPMNHMLDDIQRYDAAKPLDARIEAGDGMRALPVKAITSHIQPVTVNAAGQPVLNRDAIFGYTNGTMIELKGQTPDGQASTIRYSLLGYRSAVNAAALNCDRPDLARDLIWN